mmetsp:Transcript_30967/g.90703  ORF Transcript_30967/g.90703 Transcript_30967/m.90703 type:complete len:264 (-) Transcript_30967:1055-1846(-)
MRHTLRTALEREDSVLYQTSTAGDQARRPATTLSPPRPRREGGATLSLRVVLLGTLGRGPLFEEPPPLRHRDDRHLLRGRTRAASALAVRVGRHRQHVRAEQADDEHRGGGGVHGVLGHIPRAEQDGDDEPVEQHAEDGHGRRALRVVQFAGPHERDGRPVQPEQALKGGEGEQQRLVRARDDRHQQAERGARKHTAQATGGRDAVRVEQREALRARHLTHHEDGENEPVRDLVRRTALERGGPHEDEGVERRLVERVDHAES